MKYSIPAGLPINEQSRLLAYLKVKFHDGYFFKKDISRIARIYGKDLRTFKKLLLTLFNEGLIGEDEKTIYLRSWKFITGLKKFNLQSFECSLKNLSDKERFEVMLFSAKVTSIQKAIRKGMARERLRGGSHQIAIPTGFLAETCKVSTGKVNQLKTKASFIGLIKVSKNYLDHGPGTAQSARIASRETPGIFLKDNRLIKRNADQMESNVLTYRIRNRKTKKFIA